MNVALVCVGIVVAMAQAATSASATPPQPVFGRCLPHVGGKYADSGCTKVQAGSNKFEWHTEVPPKPKFKIHLNPIPQLGETVLLLEGTAGDWVECTHGTGVGELRSPTRVQHIALIVSGCHSGGPACQDAGFPSGEIHLEPFDGIIGVEKVKIVEGKEVPSRNTAAEEYHNETGGNFTTFECSGTAGIPTVGFSGTVLHRVGSPNKMAQLVAEKWSGGKGEQQPDRFFGGHPDEHNLVGDEPGGFVKEETGLTMSATYEWEEKVEINTVV